MKTVRRAATPHDWEQATALLHDHAEWVRVAVGLDLTVEQPGFASELTALPRQYDGSDGAVFVAYTGRVGVGIVALRGQDDGTAELKRMYVRPVARGRGIADRLIEAALDFAAGRGWCSLWLETVVGVMDPAIAVYRRNGFAEAVDRRGTLAVDGIVVMEHRVAHQLCSA